MTREQAIELARAKYAEHPGTFHKLQPLPRGDKWILGVWLTPICGWKVSSADGYRQMYFPGFDIESQAKKKRRA